MFAVITFPGLGLEFDPAKVAFTLFGWTVRWYGIILAAAFLAAAVYAIIRAPKFGITQDDFIDVITISTPIAIIGARLYYVAFQWEQYVDDPISILYIWKGGAAIYGGILGGLLAALIVTTVKKIRFTACLDVVGPAFLIGQAIGRWGNFVNQEAYGTVTNLPWRMGVTVGGALQYVHPTFLYESLWNICGFFLIHIFSKRRKYNGQVFLWYVAWYGLGRGMIEGLRTDSLYFAGTDVRVSQVLAYASLVAALLVLVYNSIFRQHDRSELADLTLAPVGAPAETEEPAVEIVDENEAQSAAYEEMYSEEMPPEEALSGETVITSKPEEPAAPAQALSEEAEENEDPEETKKD